MLKMTLIILNIAGLLASLLWLYSKPGWDSIVTLIGLIASLITLLFTRRKDRIILKQKGGKGSTNYQSKGDITINY